MKFNSIKSISFIYLFSFITVLVLSISLLSLEKIKDLMYLSIDRSLNNESDIIIALMKPDDSFIELEITEIISGNYVKPKSGHYYKMIINNNNSGFKVHDTKKILHTVISPSLVDENFNFKILSLEKKYT
jgi:hypothetical protein